MKTTIGILIVFLVAALLYFLLGRNGILDLEDITNYPPKGRQVVAFGDSLVTGVGADTDGGFVTLLSRELNLPIENLGRGGDTTAHGIERLPDMLAHKPHVVILLLGGNDFLSRVPKEEIFNNLRIIITGVQEQGAVVVLLGVRGGVLGDGYKKDFGKLARETGSAYVPNVLDGLIGNSEFMDDAIHPNESGYKIIAGRVMSILSTLLQ